MLIVVVIGAVNCPVAGLDRGLHRRLSLLCRGLPGAQPQPRHPGAIVQADEELVRRLCHVCPELRRSLTTGYP